MQYQQRIADFLVTYGFRLIGALFIVVAGAMVGGWIGKWVHGWLLRVNIEPPVRLLLARIAKLLVLALALLLASANLGVNIAPLVAGIGVIGVGIGLATQGVLSNMCAGLQIIFTKPFRVGQYIDIIGVEGQVQSIELFTTTLLHSDRSQVVIPNRKIVGEVLHNYGSTRQLELKAGVAYRTNLRALETIVDNVLKANPRVLAQPPPVVTIESLGDSQIVISIKPWVSVDNYGPAKAELYRGLIDAFHSHGVELPFPQCEVRLLGRNEAI